MTEAADRDGYVIARRTRLLPGQARNYERIHSTIPHAVWEALVEAGVCSWRIWRDGGNLVHVIRTRNGYHAMLSILAQRGPIDPVWDAIIAGLLSSAPSDDVVLRGVWYMDSQGQGPAPNGPPIEGG